MNAKQQLIDQMLRHLDAELRSLSDSTKVASQAATHEESRPENKYDTRGLEASYLAGAQAARMRDLSAVMAQLRSTELKDFPPNDPIQASAIVEVDHEGQRSWYFLVSVGGGIRLQLGEQELTSLTVQSPFGRSMLGKSVGDVLIVKTSQGSKQCEVTDVK